MTISNITTTILDAIKEVTELNEVKLFINKEESTTSLRSFPGALLGLIQTNFDKKSNVVYRSENFYSVLVFFSNKIASDTQELANQDILQKIISKVIKTKANIVLNTLACIDRSPTLSVWEITFNYTEEINLS